MNTTVYSWNTNCEFRNTVFPADMQFEELCSFQIETETILSDVADKLTSRGPTSCIKYSKQICRTRNISR